MLYQYDAMNRLYNVMKSKNALCGLSIAVALQLGVLAGSAQKKLYLYSGSERNIALNPGTYIITAYHASGGGSLGTEMSAEFNLSASPTLTRLVGGSLLGLKKYSEAEPLLLSGYQGLKQCADKIPPAGMQRPQEALQRLVELYENTGRPDQAARWQSEISGWTNQPALPR